MFIPWKEVCDLQNIYTVVCAENVDLEYNIKPIYINKCVALAEEKVGVDPLIGDLASLAEITSVRHFCCHILVVGIGQRKCCLFMRFLIRFVTNYCLVGGFNCVSNL